MLRIWPNIAVKHYRKCTKKVLGTGRASRGIGKVVCCVDFAGFVCLFVLVCAVVYVVCFDGHLWCVLSKHLVIVY